MWCAPPHPGPARVQSEFSINQGLDEGFAALEMLSTVYPTLSMADLIVLAGGLANEEAGAQPLPFCGGRVDADPDGPQSNVAPRTYYLDPVTAVLDSALVRSSRLP